MIGVIPAAGDGRRLGVAVKPLVKVRGRYLIEYPLVNMKKVGLKKAVIVERNGGVSSTLGDEYDGMELLYVEQEKSKGIADAILQVEPLVGTDLMFIILGDIIYKGNDLINAKRFFTWNRSSLYTIYGLKHVINKNEIRKSYGVISETFKAPAILVEKPIKVKKLAPFLGLGIYFASHHIFDYIHQTPTSKLREEIEWTDTLNLISQDYRAAGFRLGGYYANINTREELLETIHQLETKTKKRRNPPRSQRLKSK